MDHGVLTVSKLVSSSSLEATWSGD